MTFQEAAVSWASHAPSEPGRDGQREAGLPRPPRPYLSRSSGVPLLDVASNHAGRAEPDLETARVAARAVRAQRQAEACTCSDGVARAVPSSTSTSGGRTQRRRHREDSAVTSGHGPLFSVHGSTGFCSSARIIRSKKKKKIPLKTPLLFYLLSGTPHLNGTSANI